MTASENPLWLNDKIQFARLLCELVASGHMAVDPLLNAGLCASMDLAPRLVDELFDRAHNVWEEAKARLDKCRSGHANCDCLRVEAHNTTQPDMSLLQRLEAAFAEAGGRGVELAERIDELRKQAHSYIEKVLALSTAHMPEDPGFEGLRSIPFEYGVVVWVSEPGDGVPVWITPAMKVAYDSGCTLILFDRDCNEDPDLPTWDW